MALVSLKTNIVHTSKSLFRKRWLTGNCYHLINKEAIAVICQAFPNISEIYSLIAQKHLGTLEASHIHLKKKKRWDFCLAWHIWVQGCIKQMGMEKAITCPLDITLNPAYKKGTSFLGSLQKHRITLGDNCWGWEGPYPKRRKPCCRTPMTARSSAVPPSQGPRAHTSPGSHYGTSPPGTFCGAW